MLVTILESNCVSFLLSLTLSLNIFQVHNCREKCVRCDDGSQSCLITRAVVFNCGEPLHNGAPAGILLKGWGHRVWAATVFNTSGQGDIAVDTRFGQNKNSEFFNIGLRRFGSRGGPAVTANGTVAFAAGLYVALC